MVSDKDPFSKDSARQVWGKILERRREMSLDKSIRYGKEKRKEYYGSASFAHSCRPHGGCPYCKGNRTFSDKKARMKAKTEEQIEEYIDSAGDPADAMMDHEEVLARKIGVDLFELCMMEDEWSMQ